jgi:hypothetical protein
MLVYHGTTPQIAQNFIQKGIDCHVPYPRLIHGPQDGVPGIFVTPKISVARRFGLCILAIEVERDDLSPPPIFALNGITLEQSLENPLEPQAFLTKRIEPDCLKIVECHENGYIDNPYEPDD